MSIVIRPGANLQQHQERNKYRNSSKQCNSLCQCQSQVRVERTIRRPGGRWIGSLTRWRQMGHRYYLNLLTIILGPRRPQRRAKMARSRLASNRLRSSRKPKRRWLNLFSPCAAGPGIDAEDQSHNKLARAWIVRDFRENWSEGDFQRQIKPYERSSLVIQWMKEQEPPLRVVS